MAQKHKGSQIITKDSTIDGTLKASGITYPTSDGTTNQVIKTDGGGNLSFTNQTGGGAAFDFVVAQAFVL